MGQSSGDLDLAQKAVRPECGGELGAEDFDGDETLVFDIASEVDTRHPAAAELALNRVARAQGSREPSEFVGYDHPYGRPAARPTLRPIHSTSTP